MPEAKAAKATAKKASPAPKKKAPARKATTKVVAPKVAGSKVAARKVAVPKVEPRVAQAKVAEPKKRAPRRIAAPKPKTLPVIGPPVDVPPPAPPETPAIVIEDAQSQVVASKFANTDAAPAKTAARPNLPTSYGESHLLLLVRDPQTLFAAWDISPSTTESLKSRLGRRGFAVSNLTLRLTRAGGPTTLVHAGKKARSRYLKIDGGPSYVAEVGFTTPAGQFEFVARSAPCFVPVGPVERRESAQTERRAVGYREAAALGRRGGLGPDPGPEARARRNGDSSASSGRDLGGASDLYRR
jgi:hypothetical protein